MPDIDTTDPTPVDPTPAPADPTPADPPADDGPDTDWKAKYEQSVKEGRKWEGRAKENHGKLTQVEQQAQAQLDAIAKALGLKGDDTPDPAKLADDLTQSQSEARATKVENAVLRAESKAGVNADALTDSRAFMSTVEALDPADADFTSKLGDAITAALDANPALKGTPQTPRSGTEIAGTTATGQLTRADLATMSPDAIVKAKADGRLNDLLGIR